jgi:hypothetical protein
MVIQPTAQQLRLLSYPVLYYLRCVYDVLGVGSEAILNRPIDCMYIARLTADINIQMLTIYELNAEQYLCTSTEQTPRMVEKWHDLIQKCWGRSRKQHMKFMYVCNRWAKICPALALGPLRCIVLPLLVYPFVNLTLLMMRRTFLMGVSW